ncbi:carboxylating nicotinate-nucleotide diphosphorylase [Planococcus sp. CP5-4]|uniref:carboxylating nicotinate-nucleotide diphosphorylase n=1 Tax=unclassified Planococcus (in: firmicutes) TaxID=2662419 RepID=UPI001C23C834|nr:MULTISPECIES: carboxylating nicotinate-nucleotide diphosphorylase [unclassified Planococcus (in: firmicutes)]MBU9674745.1 carboxylating nicotinate-nucleotide diphosphorylase [Planococcus sp. CP5-4_YE]MBV0910334.1 carboxylating nicotinate-nucleotide diphosphorylase [Planococcus sp. CP5-4_UN]MBW6063890.1 carboxylating nicotinate-nucleotide diphosphorylase [Planococcus sp. CP5-4]
MNRLKAEQALTQFLLEDIGDRDVSSVLFDRTDTGEAFVRMKQSGIVAGLDCYEWGYRLLDQSVEVELLKQDGDRVEAGEAIVKISGPVASLLAGERVLLNLIQRMSGVATLTAKCVEALGSSHTRIVDTRKTTPGLRMFEKYAVRAGGGFNHRNGLYDAVMLKDNHIAAAGSINEAVKKVRDSLGHMTMIEVEVETEVQLHEAIEARPNTIMFDNQAPETIRRWAQLVPESIRTEASGGIDLEKLAHYRNTGVDVISIGALTHSVSNLDMSMNLSISPKEVLTT